MVNPELLIINPHEPQSTIRLFSMFVLIVLAFLATRNLKLVPGKLQLCAEGIIKYFNDIAKNTKIGLNEYMEYQTEKATVTELKTQNSYFINALYKNADSE